jgi:hypothetical protein
VARVGLDRARLRDQRQDLARPDGHPERLAAGRNGSAEFVPTGRKGSALSSARVDGGVITEVEGSAYRTGSAEFVLDPDDQLGTGFLLR